MEWSDPAVGTIAAADAPGVPPPPGQRAGQQFSFVVPGSSGPRIDIQWGLWRRPKVCVAGRQLPHRGRLRRRREIVTLDDGTQRELRLAGFLNRVVVVDGSRYPLERRLRAWEYVLAGLPLILVILLGAVPILLGLAGARINTSIARSTLRAPARGAAMIGVFLAAAMITAVTVGLSFFAVGRSGDSHAQPATWPFQTGTCVAGPLSGTPSLAQFHAVACSSQHVGEVIGIPRDPVAEYPGEAALDAFAQGRCGAAFSEHVGRPFEEDRDGYMWFTPDASAFDAVDGTVLCIGTKADGAEFTGPLGG